MSAVGPVEWIQGAAAGIGGAVLALLGVDAPTLTAALIGCVFGVSQAPPTGRAHAVLLFLASVSASAITASVLGPLLAAWLTSVRAELWCKGIALGVGVVLHPAIQAASVATPVLIRKLFARVGGGT